MAFDSNHVTLQQPAGAPGTFNATQPLPQLYTLKPLGAGVPAVAAADPGYQAVNIEPGLRGPADPMVALPAPAAVGTFSEPAGGTIASTTVVNIVLVYTNGNGKTTVGAVATHTMAGTASLAFVLPAAPTFGGPAAGPYEIATTEVWASTGASNTNYAFQQALPGGASGQVVTLNSIATGGATAPASNTTGTDPFFLGKN